MGGGILCIEKYGHAKTMIGTETCDFHVVNTLECGSDQHGREDRTRTGCVQSHLISVSHTSKWYHSNAMREELVRVTRCVDVYAHQMRSLRCDVAQKAAAYRITEANAS